MNPFLARMRTLFTLPVILAALGIAALLWAMSIAGLFVITPRLPITPTAAPAQIAVIPHATSTPIFLSPTPVPSPTVETTSLPPSPLPGVIGVGAYVQIYGTQGDGLNLRTEPGLNTEVQFLGYDSEVFEVREGPIEVDGFTWWLLVTPVDEARQGWAAANYLSVVPAP